MSDAVAVDVLEIDNLMGAYAAVSDSGFHAEGYAPLWADDCEVAIGADLRVQGKAAVLELLSGIAATVPWAFHQFSRETLHFNADRTEAFCTWSLLALNTTLGANGPSAMVVTGRYRCVLTKLDSGWVFRSVNSEFYNNSEWRVGWVAPD